MNNTTAIVGGIIAVVIIGGLIMYSMGNTDSSSSTATSTPDSSTSTGGDNDTTSGQTRKAGAPIAVTSANTSSSDTTVIVSGSVTPNGALTSYWYEFGKTENFGNKTASQTMGSGYATIPAPAYITGLSKDTTYFFRLVAENTHGRVMGDRYTFKTSVSTPAPVGSIPSVKTLAANGVSRTTVNLNGEVTPNQAQTQYWFEYGETADLGNTTALTSAGDGNTKIPVSIALSDLNPATTYYFRLNAQNQFGTKNGSTLNFKTSGPSVTLAPVVTTQVASSIATTTATMRGTVHPNGTQTTYWFEYSTDSLLGSILLKTTPEKSVGAGTKTISVEANISGLQSGMTYYYRTVGENSAGIVRGERLSFKTK